MPYKNKQDKRDYEKFYRQVRKYGYTLKDLMQKETIKCLWCGADFIPKSERHKYCKNACRQRAFWDNREKNACQNAI